MDPAEFQRVIREKEWLKLRPVFEKPAYYKTSYFPLDNRVVGIFIDITNELKQREELSWSKPRPLTGPGK